MPTAIRSSARSSRRWSRPESPRSSVGRHGTHCAVTSIGLGLWPTRRPGWPTPGPACYRFALAAAGPGRPGLDLAQIVENPDVRAVVQAAQPRRDPGEPPTRAADRLKSKYQPSTSGSAWRARCGRARVKRGRRARDEAPRRPASRRRRPRGNAGGRRRARAAAADRHRLRLAAGDSPAADLDRPEPAAARRAGARGAAADRARPRPAARPRAARPAPGSSSRRRYLVLALAEREPRRSIARCTSRSIAIVRPRPSAHMCCLIRTLL